MNAAEHIVDAYFRLARGCFTFPDCKVKSGNNRQLDILAFHLKTKSAFHIEIGVTHRENWCPTLEELSPHFEKKFFGAPPERKGRSEGTTDFEKGKSYWNQIETTYKEIGFNSETVQRIWVCWLVKGLTDAKPIKRSFHSKHLSKSFDIEIISLRDHVLPELEKAIGTSNYEDEVLRTLGFLKQREIQIAKRN